MKQRRSAAPESRNKSVWRAWVKVLVSQTEYMKVMHYGLVKRPGSFTEKILEDLSTLDARIVE